jgi:hypothetical protein
MYPTNSFGKNLNLLIFGGEAASTYLIPCTVTLISFANPTHAISITFYKSDSINSFFPP